MRDLNLSNDAKLWLYYRPQRSWDKVMFLHVSVILFTGGVISQHALQVVSQHALLVSKGWGWYPSMSCRFPGPHPGGAWVVWPGGSPGSHPGGKSRCLAWGVSRPTPGVKLRGLALGRSPGPHLGDLQAHTQAGLQPHTWGSPGPHLEGVYPSMYCRQLLPQVVCILLECIPVFWNIYHITRIVDT